MKRYFSLFIFILASSTFAAADVYIKTKNHMDPISMGGQNQPAKDTYSEQWIGDGKLANISPSQTVILDNSKKLVYLIFHKSKTYVSANLPLNLDKLMPPELAGIMKSMKMTATVNPTGKKKIIGARSCDEYDVSLTSMTRLKMKLYATTNVPFDLKKYEQFQNALLKSQMMGMDDATVKEFTKIKGYQIATESTIDAMGTKIKSSSTIIEISNKPAPAGIYSAPPGYARRDKLSIEDMQNQ